MTTRLVHIVATSREQAEESLLAGAPIDYRMRDKEDAKDIARILNGKDPASLKDGKTFQVFSAEVTVKFLED